MLTLNLTRATLTPAPAADVSPLDMHQQTDARRNTLPH